MKILLAADLQLEGGQSLGHGEYGPGSRFHDQELMLQHIADIASREEIHLCILAGDTFDKPKPSPWAILALKYFLERMPETFILAGNHDVKSLELPNILECFAGREGRVRLYDRSGFVERPQVRISMLPWMPAAAAVDSDAGEIRDLTHDRVAAYLAETAARLAAHSPRDDWRHILVGHWTIGGAVSPNGVDAASIYREPIIPLESLSGFDMVAFGHIHKVQVLRDSPPVLYLGSPWVNNFGEAGQPHGVWVYDTDGPEMRFVPVPDRKFLTYTNDDTIDIGDTVGAVVRVRLDVTEEEARGIDTAGIASELRGPGRAHKVFVQTSVEKRERARVVLPEAGTEDAVALWLSENTDLERGATLHAVHKELLARVTNP